MGDDTPVSHPAPIFSVEPEERASNTRSVPRALQCCTTREDLLPALALMQAIAEKRSSLPILAHVYLQAHPEGNLELRATDLELGLTCSCPATVKAAGACTVEARRLYEIVRALPAGEFRLEASASTSTSSALTLTYNKSRFRFPSLDPQEFPHLALPDAVEHTIQIPAMTLRDMIDKTLFASASDETRLQLHSVFFEPCSGEHVRLVASDGHRLALIERAVPGLPADLQPVLLPLKGLAEARKLLEPAKDEHAILTFSKAVVTLAVATTTLTLRVVDAEFPAYRDVIPARHTHCLAVSRTDLTAALRRLLVLTTEQTRGVVIKVERGRMELSVKSPDLGEGVEEVPVEYTGPGITIGFNGRYLLDMLGVVEAAERVMMALTEPAHPGVISVRNDDSYQYIVMPMRTF